MPYELSAIQSHRVVEQRRGFEVGGTLDTSASAGPWETLLSGWKVKF